MRPIAKCLFPTLAAALTLAACGSSSSSTGSSSQASTSTSAATVAASPPSATTAVVRTASNAKLGATVLTNAAGMTLYTLSGEGNGKFICTSSACLHVWHPLTVTGAAAPSGGVGSLATVKRSDGTVQVTYKGVPLYTFADDKAPGEDNGQGIKDVGTWSAVTVSSGGTSTARGASGAASSEPATSESEGSGSKGSSGAYGY
jgi:predicted lipoprotein with Yx(FWY)xxD motif